MHGDSASAGGVSADARRAERVEIIGAIIHGCYALAQLLDAQKGEAANAKLDQLVETSERLFEVVQGEVAAIREGERSSETLHGEDSEAEEITLEGDSVG